MYPNLCPGIDAWVLLQLNSWVQFYIKVSMMQLAHSKVALSKLGYVWRQVCHGTLTDWHRCQTDHWIASERSTATDLYVCLCLSPDRTWHKVNDLKIDYSGDLVQCGPGEPSRKWTQMWVQLRLPDYSLNWKTRSKGKRCQWCSSSTQKWPSRSRVPFILNLLLNGQRHARMPDNPLKSLCTMQWLITRYFSTVPPTGWE